MPATFTTVKIGDIIDLASPDKYHTKGQKKRLARLGNQKIQIRKVHKPGMLTVTSAVSKREGFATWWIEYRSCTAEGKPTEKAGYVSEHDLSTYWRARMSEIRYSGESDLIIL